MVSVRYSPPNLVSINKERIVGRPDPSLISTAYVERQNLTTLQAGSKIVQFKLGQYQK